MNDGLNCVEGSGSVICFKAQSRHLSGGTEENDDDPQFTRSELSEYEVGMLTTRPQHSVISYSEV